MDFSDIEKMVAKVLSGDDIFAQRQIVCSLIYYEKIKILDQIRHSWGEDYWRKVVETV
jgi:hypothetical protein